VALARTVIDLARVCVGGRSVQSARHSEAYAVSRAKLSRDVTGCRASALRVGVSGGAVHRRRFGGPPGDRRPERSGRPSVSQSGGAAVRVATCAPPTAAP
jgi:hypothetical protein